MPKQSPAFYETVRRPDRRSQASYRCEGQCAASRRDDFGRTATCGRRLRERMDEGARDMRRGEQNHVVYRLKKNRSRRRGLGGSIDGLAMSGGAHSLERNSKYASGVVCSCEHQLTRRRSIVGLPTNVWSARSWLRLPRRRLAICSGPPFGAASRTAAMKTAFVIADLLKRSLCARCASNFCAHARVLLAPGDALQTSLGIRGPELKPNPLYGAFAFWNRCGDHAFFYHGSDRQRLRPQRIG
jgi:hypothetical protein